MIDIGIIIPRRVELPALLASLAAELDHCSWLICSQRGPFHYNWAEADRAYDDLFLFTDACDKTSASCWRAGTLPRHAEHVVVDEWTYLIAMSCPEEAVPARAAELLAPQLGRFSSEFFCHLERAADMFIMHGDGWWEVYTANRDWQQRLRHAFGDAYERPSALAGTAPDTAA